MGQPKTFVRTYLESFGVRTDALDDGQINQEFRNLLLFLRDQFNESQRMDTLYTKAETTYRNEASENSGGSLEETCAACQNYIPGGRCNLVRGSISPEGNCDLWKDLPQPFGLYKQDGAEPTRKIITWNGIKIGITHEADKDVRFGQSLRGISYGRIYRSWGQAEDGKAIDAWVGPDLEDGQAFWFQQINPEDGSPDERKLVIGFRDRATAKQALQDNFPMYLRDAMFGGLYDATPDDLAPYRQDALTISQETRISPVSGNQDSVESDETYRFYYSSDRPQGDPFSYHADGCGCNVCAAKGRFRKGFVRKESKKPKARELEDVEAEPDREELAPKGFVGDDGGDDADTQDDAQDQMREAIAFANQLIAYDAIHADTKVPPERFRVGFRYVPANASTGRSEYWAKDKRVRDREQKLIHDGFVSQEEFAQLKPVRVPGHRPGMNLSYFVQSPDGRRYLYKESTGLYQADDAASEVLAAQVAHSVGIPANQTRIITPALTGRLTRNTDLATLHSEVPGIRFDSTDQSIQQQFAKPTPFQTALTHPDLARIYALDVFTGNGDRHFGNYMYDGASNRFHAIDMGDAFAEHDKPNAFIHVLDYHDSRGLIQNFTPSERKNMQVLTSTLKSLRAANPPQSMVSRFHYFRYGGGGISPKEAVLSHSTPPPTDEKEQNIITLHHDAGLVVEKLEEVSQ